MLRKILLIVLFLMAVTAVFAQDTTLPEAIVVNVEATDGLTLVGDFYALEGDVAAVLLLHMYGADRSSWEPLIPALLEAGYHVLAVDLRAHGETGGDEDWEAGLLDVQTWLNWLREQTGVRPEALSIVGASIGANLALMGCAADTECTTAVALSPGLDYFNVVPETALSEGLSERSALLIASHNDAYSAHSIVELARLGTGEIGLRLYTGGEHGTELFGGDHAESITALILNWLNEHTPAAS
jgi:pimeloyl-ACP methyl ester carboxylesterase